MLLDESHGKVRELFKFPGQNHECHFRKWKNLIFTPRPYLAEGYCRPLDVCPSVRPSVRLSTLDDVTPLASTILVLGCSNYIH